MILAERVVHVATDWPALGLFFVGLVGTIGGGVAWVMRRMDRNRDDWKAFVKHEVEVATEELKAQVSRLAGVTDDNSRELREQGKAIARIEGRLGTNTGPSTGQL